MTFWLGLPRASFLPRAGVPACVHAGLLMRRRTVPQPAAPVLVDSWGFTELQRHGRYTFAAADYAACVRRCRAEWGDRLAAASVMDWMCEPDVIAGNPEKGFAGTGLSVAEHQRRTVASWDELRQLAPELPWFPVLQGFHPDDYHRCADLYERAGTDLAALPLVGLGSVCRRQGMAEAGVVVKSLYARGYRNLHGFGFKVTGLVSRGLRLARYLASSDSMAWSRVGREEWDKRGRRCCRLTHPGGCANCLPWALEWRDRLVRRAELVRRGGTQGVMW